MKRPAKLLFACVTTIIAGVASEVAIPAENSLVAQQLEKVMASGQLTSAILTRQSDFYTLQLVLDVAKYDAREKAIVAANRKELAANPPPPEVMEAERPAYFIGNTIANLRGTSPWSPCGARTVAGRLVYLPVVKNPSDARDNRVTVWLLKADGTQILPAGYSCVANAAAVDVQYRFSIAEGERAVATAVRIDNEYYIEKLQPLQPKRSAEQSQD